MLYARQFGYFSLCSAVFLNVVDRFFFLSLSWNFCRTGTLLEVVKHLNLFKSPILLERRGWDEQMLASSRLLADV